MFQPFRLSNTALFLSAFISLIVMYMSDDLCVTAIETILLQHKVNVMSILARQSIPNAQQHLALVLNAYLLWMGKQRKLRRFYACSQLIVCPFFKCHKEFNIGNERIGCILSVLGLRSLLSISIFSSEMKNARQPASRINRQSSCSLR